MRRLRLLLALSSIAALGAAASASGQSAHSSTSHAVVHDETDVTGHDPRHELRPDALSRRRRQAGALGLHRWLRGGVAGVGDQRRKPTAAGKAKASDLGTIKHGKATQVTYGGHPLYTFRADSKRSPTSGEGVNGFYLVSPSGSKITKPPTTKKKPPSTTPGY